MYANISKHTAARCSRLCFPKLKKSNGEVRGCVTDGSQKAKDDTSFTHFGFTSVPEAEKSKKVHEVFTNVATKYDLMNDVMSGGLHRVWKDQLMWRMQPGPSTKLIDVAGGTGDIALRFCKYISVKHQRALRKLQNSEKASATIVDVNNSMLEVGQQKQHEALSNSNHVEYPEISWKLGDAEKLPFAENTFDMYTIAFGIRNCTNPAIVLKEAHRVLKPGGRFYCLEFSHVSHPFIGRIYDWYSFEMIPVFGHLIAGDWRSYQYLVESIRQFPSQEQFQEVIQSVGFHNVSFENLSFGVCAIHCGLKAM